MTQAKAFLKEFRFPSTEHTYIRNMTHDINEVIKKANIQQGFVTVTTKHTTLGVLVNEIAEPNLLQDVLHHTFHSVPEDKRSTRVTSSYAHPTKDYMHRCQDNPYCDEMDEDYNAAAHIRTLTFSHPSVTIPIRNGKLELGKYQEVAVFEFDGRDGTGKNPIRQRTVQVWLYQVAQLQIID